MEKGFSNPEKLECGVPQGSILGPLLFLLYANDMLGDVGCEMPLYADDTCLVFQAKDLDTLSDRLNTEFNQLCDWFVDNKLSIHFGEDKTKSILFTGKNRSNADKLNISRVRIKVAQHKKINYFGCLFDEKSSGESMALKVIERINGRLKFVWLKHKFLTSALRRLLCNALIQPHFDYASSAWYPNLQNKLSDKLQVCQNKSIRFCLSLGNRSHIGIKEFKEINWLPFRARFEQNFATHIFKQQNKLAP